MLAGDPMHGSQKTLGLAVVPEQPKVVPEHHNGIESPRSKAPDLFDRAERRVLHPARPADADSERRVVDGDHLNPLLLQIEGDSSRPAADIKGPPSRGEAHRELLPFVPVPEGRKVVADAVSDGNESVVPLNDVVGRPALKELPEFQTECISFNHDGHPS